MAKNLHTGRRTEALSIARLLAEAYSSTAADRHGTERSFLDGWHGSPAGGTDKTAMKAGASFRGAVCHN